MIKNNARADKKRTKRKKREGKRKECDKITEQEHSFSELWPTGGKNMGKRGYNIVHFVVDG